MNVKTELSECPFCGAAAEPENPDKGCYSNGCGSCFFSLMGGDIGIGWYETKEKADTAWNRRSDRITAALTLMKQVESGQAVVVPRNPTSEMFEAAASFGGGGGYSYQRGCEAVEAWGWMIAAAPKPEQKENL